MTTKSTPSPRAARTRSALIGAGFDLLSQKPIDAIPIDEFVATAGVGKGSFFNHFADKQAFADAIADEVRRELEEQIARANAGMDDPIQRIAGGMRVSASFAMVQPKRAIVLLRSNASMTSRHHPLNKGLVGDVEAACALGLLRTEARESGVLYWLGLCYVLMAHMVDGQRSDADAQRWIDDMIVLGLAGLGVDEVGCARALSGSRAWGGIQG